MVSLFDASDGILRKKAFVESKRSGESDVSGEKPKLFLRVISSISFAVKSTLKFVKSQVFKVEN